MHERGRRKNSVRFVVLTVLIDATGFGIVMPMSFFESPLLTLR
jgi:hypothetical protein